MFTFFLKLLPHFYTKVSNRTSNRWSYLLSIFAAMSALIYYLIIKPLSLLPLRVLYLLSGPARFIIYRLIGYRKKVVRKQLLDSFPELSPTERLRIEKQFYHHFVDLIIESLKVFSISASEALERCTILNPEVIEQLYEQNRHVAVVAGHYANWELPTMIIQQLFRHDVTVIYSELSNPFFNKKITASRSKYGLSLVTRKEVHPFMEQAKDPIGLVFLSDQSPTSLKKAYWTTFLNQPTGVNSGVEFFAKKYDMAVLFAHIRKTSRGRYSIFVQLLEDNPIETADGHISERHTSALESIIKEQPELWLWTHRRWKHKPPETVVI